MNDDDSKGGPASGASVTGDEVTLHDQEQPSGPSSVTDAAMTFLRQLRSNGEDVIGQKLSKKRAEEIGSKLGCGPGVIYNARKRIIEDDARIVSEHADENVDAKVETPDIEAMFKDTKPVGDGPSEPNPPNGEVNDDSDFLNLQEKKEPPTPIDIKTIQTISDAILEAGASAMRDKGKPVKEANLKALKTVYNCTYESYNASIPKSALLPIVVVFTLIVFVGPFLPEILKFVKDMRKPKAHDGNPLDAQ